MGKICERCKLDLNYDKDARRRKLVHIIVNAPKDAGFMTSALVQRAMLSGDARSLPPICHDEARVEPCGAGEAIGEVQEEKSNR